MSKYSEVEKFKDALRETPEYEKAYEKALARQHEKCDREAIKAICTHPTSTYQPDPSGNNDGGSYCDVCGVDV